MILYGKHAALAALANPMRKIKRVMNFLCFLLAFILVLSFSFKSFASSAEKPWRVEYVGAELNFICEQADKVTIPEQDKPTDDDKKKLANCSSRNLYYGIPKKDYVAARKCAFIEYNQEPRDSSYAILMMIYANGYGVKKDYNIALKMACNMWSAPAELGARVTRIIDKRDHPLTDIERKKCLEEPSEIEKDCRQEIDLCDDITSGMMSGVCSSIKADIDELENSKKMENLTAKWSEEHKKEFEKLNKIALEYFKTHADNENDSTGTLRGAFYIEEKAEMLKNFRKSVADFENGKFPSYSANDLTKFDKELNSAYKKVQKINFEKEYPISGIDLKGIKETELSWIKYRDSWVEFAKLHYPEASSNGIKAWLTIDRTDILEKIPCPCVSDVIPR
jgi:uncharacterized protein YecT (DUF1311 family)